MGAEVSEPTHRDLCRAAARWLLSGLSAATYEIAFNGGQADAIGITTPEPAATVDLRGREYATAHIRREERQQARLRKRNPAAGLWEIDRTPPPGLGGYQSRMLDRLAVPPRVVVAECKRTRSDLLADLRVGKLRAYEPAATHCWLVATREAFRVPTDRHVTTADIAEAAAQATADGLPEAWGIALVATDRSGSVRVAHIARDAARLRDAEPWEVRAWADRMLASMCHRALGDGPMADEMNG